MFITNKQIGYVPYVGNYSLSKNTLRSRNFFRGKKLSLWLKLINGAA